MRVRTMQRGDCRLQISMYRNLRKIGTKSLLRAQSDAIPPLICLPQTTLRIRRFAAFGFEKMNARHAKTRTLKQNTLRRMWPWQAYQQSHR